MIYHKWISVTSTRICPSQFFHLDQCDMTFICSGCKSLCSHSFFVFLHISSQIWQQTLSSRHIQNPTGSHHKYYHLPDPSHCHLSHLSFCNSFLSVLPLCPYSFRNVDQCVALPENRSHTMLKPKSLEVQRDSTSSYSL